MTTPEQVQNEINTEEAYPVDDTPIEEETKEVEDVSSVDKRAAPDNGEDESNHTAAETAIVEDNFEEEKKEVAVTEEEETDQINHQHMTTSPTSIIPQRPVKRARTAYFIFAEEKRPELSKQVRPIVSLNHVKSFSCRVDPLNERSPCRCRFNRMQEPESREWLNC